MKIIFFTRLFYPHIGGIEKHLDKICDLLIARGHEVTILTTKHNSSLADKEFYKGVKILRFSQPNIKFLGLVYTWLWLLKNYHLLKNSDILHIHDVFIWYWPSRIINPNKNVFLTIHGRWGVYPIHWKDVIQKKISTRFSDGVIAIGEYITKNYKIDADIISYGATETPKRASIKTKNNIVYVGRLDKDIPLVKSFEVFRQLKDYNIDFCGDGELASDAEQYGQVHGFTDPELYYQRARYCFASGYLTILEALAHKCLVFTLFENPLQEDYYKLTPFSNFIITSARPEVIYNRLKYFEKNVNEAEKMIDSGYRWVKQQTWNKMLDNYLYLWSK